MAAGLSSNEAQSTVSVLSWRQRWRHVNCKERAKIGAVALKCSRVRGDGTAKRATSSAAVCRRRGSNGGFYFNEKVEKSYLTLSPSHSPEH